MASENWVYPTRFSYGTPSDKYYAEIWYDGMDWNKNYWLLESANYDNPVVYPVVHFESTDEEAKMNHHEREELFRGIMHYRRAVLWFKDKDPKGYFSDSLWPFIEHVLPKQKMEKCPCLELYRMLHASQPRVEFYMNSDLVPDLTVLRPNTMTTEDGTCTMSSEYPQHEILPGADDADERN